MQVRSSANYTDSVILSRAGSSLATSHGRYHVTAVTSVKDTAEPELAPELMQIPGMWERDAVGRVAPRSRDKLQALAAILG